MFSTDGRDPVTATASRLTGEVVRAGDPAYEAARLGWNRLYSRYPEAIVFCRDTSDVVNAVEWAREHGIGLRARSGRHNLEGWSAIDGGLIIDVSRLKSVHVHEGTRTATVGTGLNQKEVVAALGRSGYVVPTGSEGAVGLGGVVLGGGFGLLTRAMGLACDHLVGAEIVVPDGSRSAKVLQVSKDSDAELLWACRGGGGNNFGIATSYTFRLHELADVAFGFLTWTGHDRLGDLLRTWQREAPVADDRLSSALEIGADGVALSALLYGGSGNELTEALRPLLAIGTPEVTVTEDSWPAVYADVDKAPPDIPNWKFFSQFVKRPLPDEAIELICDFMANPPSATSNYFLSSFGGAVRQEPPGGSAFPHRDALFYCEPGAGWSGPELNARALGWVAEFARAMRPYVDGAYVNVPNAAAADWEAQYYGANLQRLRQVKTRYDPSNVFRFEQSVPVASG